MEYLETFNVSLKQVTNNANLGNEITIVVNIPPNDSPIGLFGFETNRVSMSQICPICVSVIQISN